MSNLVTNGTFDQNIGIGETIQGWTTIGNWAVIDGTAHSYWSDNNTTLAQAITGLEAGKTYKLTFDVCEGSTLGYVRISGQPVWDEEIESVDVKTHNFVFTAIEGQQDLFFQALGYFILDNIIIEEVISTSGKSIYGTNSNNLFGTEGKGLYGENISDSFSTEVDTVFGD